MRVFARWFLTVLAVLAVWQFLLTNVEPGAPYYFHAQLVRVLRALYLTRLFVACEPGLAQIKFKLAILIRKQQFPVYALVGFGVYLLGLLVIGVLNFRSVPSEYESLKKVRRRIT